MERLHKFVNGPSLQFIHVFLLASLDLGYHVHPPLFMLSPQLLVNISFIFLETPICQSIMGYSKLTYSSMCWKGKPQSFQEFPTFPPPRFLSFQYQSFLHNGQANWLLSHCPSFFPFAFWWMAFKLLFLKPLCACSWFPIFNSYNTSFHF